MKILCLHQGFELYGSDRSFILSLQVIKKIYPHAHLTVIIPREGPIQGELSLVADRLLVQDIGSLSRSDIKKPFRSFGRIFKRTREAITLAKDYDLVYINTVVVLSHIVAAGFTRKTTIVHVREIPGRLESLIFSLMLRFSKAFILYNSRSTRNAFVWQNERKEFVILNAVEGFPKLEPAPPEPIKLLMIGRINAWKGQLLLAEAIAALPADYRSKIQVRFVGDVPAGMSQPAEDLRRIIRENSLEQTADIFPFAADPSSHYRWANIVVTPSIRPEPFGRVAIEGMSIGKPVLAAEHGGLTEIIEDNVNGWFFKPGDKLSLQAKLIEIINHPGKITELGKMAETTFRQKFIPSIYEANLKNILNIIIK